jgi:hypothetical protein
MRRLLAVVVALSACRFGFDRSDTARDAPPVVDSTPVFDDAPLAPYCTPLGVAVTQAQCAAAFADPAAASDQVLYDCADVCALHACILFEGPKDGCSACACNAYIKSSVICDAGGLCGPPLNGTGCILQGAFTGAPWNCPSTLTLPETVSCVMRVLISMRDC